MESFIHALVSHEVALAFISCNIAPLVIFGVPYLFTRLIYPRARSRFEKNCVSIFVGFFLLGLFLYPTPAAFRILALLNLSIVLLIVFIYWIFKAFPHSNKVEKIIVRTYVAIVPVFCVFFMLNFGYRAFVADPKSIATLFAPSFFIQYTMLCFLFLLPAVGTFWLARDARRRRQKTKEIWEKAEKVKK
jgi:hypothetical protein